MNDLEQLQQNLETYHSLKYKAQPDLRSARARNNGRKQALLAHIPSLIAEIYYLRSLKESNAETIEFLSKAADLKLCTSGKDGKHFDNIEAFLSDDNDEQVSDLLVGKVITF